MQVKTDLDEANGHPWLAELLAGEYAAQLNSLTRRRYLDAIEAAMLLPAGAPRRAVLRALSSGVGAQLRSHELRDDAQRLRLRLATEMPQAQHLEEGHEKVRVLLHLLASAFKKAWAADIARGQDLSNSSMAWFEHELLTYSPAILAAVRGMAVSGSPKPAAPLAPPPVDELP